MKFERIIKNRLFNHPGFVSVCLHGFLLFTLSLIIFDDEIIKQPVFISLITPGYDNQKSNEKTEPETKIPKETGTKKTNVEPEFVTIQRESTVTIEVEDSILDKPEIIVSDSVRPAENELYLKFARTFLDSLLISNPGYSRLILTEKIKGLKDSVFARQELERKVNDAIHKYLMEHYPEGSGNAINQYTGPGINIPIDDLIGIIKGIF